MSLNFDVNSNLLLWGPHTQREESRLECTRHGVQLKLRVCGEECGTRIQVSWNQDCLDFWRAHSNPRGDNLLCVATSLCMLRLKFSGGRTLSDLRNMSREYNTGARHCYQTNFLFGHHHNERLLHN
jgi:hypothetical protein